jgi:predicted nuclease of predicted toxin-antitoxin system
VALRQRGYDVVTTAEVGLLEASDEEQLVYAVSQQRALVTHNIKHFPGVHAAWIEASRVHWGVVVLIGH